MHVMFRLLFIVATFLTFIPLAHAGEDLGAWKVTRYYTPIEGQERYYNGWARNAGTCKTSNLYYAPYKGKRLGDYSAEACMQGSGDLFITADGTDLHDVTPFSVAACPRKYLGRTLHVADIGYVRCADVGGGVKGMHIDLWAGVGEEGYNNIATQQVKGLLPVHLKGL